jgi:Spy/CpxP family protein refolding chaperone
MKGAKLFTASLAVLALALGFFLGNFCGNGSLCCSKGEMSCCKKMDGPCCCKGEMACCKKMEGPCPRHGMMPPPPPGGPHHPGDFDKGPGHHGDHKFKHKMDPAVIDSLMQVTPEQKAALDESRAKGDSIFKELRKQKHDAEKALGEALESRDAASIDAAKAKVLDADKALLEHRINGMQALAKVLTPEQLEKFNQFHKEQMKKFKERMKKGPKEGPQEGPQDGPKE